MKKVDAENLSRLLLDHVFSLVDEMTEYREEMEYILSSLAGSIIANIMIAKHDVDEAKKYLMKINESVFMCSKSKLEEIAQNEDK